MVDLLQPMAHLDEPTVVSSYDELSVWTDATTPCNVLEPRYCLGDLLRAGCVNLDSRCSSHGISVWFCCREVNRGNRGVFLDEYWVLELAPVPRLWRMLGGGGPVVPLDGDGLVIHGRGPK